MNPLIQKLLPDLRRRWELRAWRGDEHRCPCCEGRWALFDLLGKSFPVIEELQIVGAGTRRASCPQCRSTDRERLLLLYFRERTSLLRERLRVLHIAPERNLRRILGRAPNLDYTAGDKFERGSPDHIKGPDVEKIEIAALPFADEAFDVVICNHVLEHVPDDRKAMSELLRVLRRGGWAVLQVPVSLVLEKTLEDPSVDTPKERTRRFGQRDHVRVYAPDDYVARLEWVGFEVRRDRYASELSAADQRAYAIDPREELFIARRP